MVWMMISCLSTCVNYIELSAPEYSQMGLGIVGDELGDQGTPVSWRLGLVRKSGDLITYQDGSGDPQVMGSTSSETLTLVVMPIALIRMGGAVFLRVSFCEIRRTSA